MENYPMNPNKPQLPSAKKQPPKVKATEVKKSGFERWLSSIIVEDWASIKRYAFGQVLLPGIKRLANDVLVKIINAAFNGVGTQGKSSSSVGSEYTNYNAISNPVRVVGSSNMVQPYRETEVSKRYEFKHLGYASEREANEVLEQLRDDIRNYKIATLLHYYEYSDVDTSSTESNWGWKNLDYAEVYFDVNSQLWVIKLPKVIPLD